MSVWRQLLGVMSSMSAPVPGAKLRMRSLQHRLNVSGSSSVRRGCGVLGRLLPPGSSVVVRRFSSPSGSAPQGGSPRPALVHRHLGHRLGCLSRRRPSLWLVVSPLLPLFYQPPGAFGGFVCGSRVSSICVWPCGGGVLLQHHDPGVPQETGWHSIFHSQCGGSDGSSPLRVLSRSTPSLVHSGPVECPCGFSEPQEPGHRLRVDPVFGGFLSASSPVATGQPPLISSS